MQGQDFIKELTKSGEWFVNVIENNSIGLIFADLETTRLRYVNKSFLTSSGYTSEDLVGKSSVEANLIDPLVREKTIDLLHKKGGIKNIELLIKRKDGGQFWTQSSVQVMAIDGKKYAITSFVDITESKQTEEKLMQLAAIVQYSDDAIISKTLEGTIKSWNKGAEKMFGFTSQEAVGKNISIIIPDNYLEEEKGILKKVGNNEIVEQHETIRHKKDGQLINVALTVSAILNKNGEVTGISKIARDITEKKKASYARNLIEASLDPLVTISVAGKITDVNKALVEITGVVREKLTGTDFSNYFTEAEKAREGYRQAFEEGFVANYPLTIKHQNGKLTDVLYNASVYKDEKDNVLGVFAAARDVTLQKQTSQYARSLIEASLDPLVTISANGKITDMNEATVNITGITRAKLKDTDFFDYFTEPQRAREVYLEVFAKGSVVDSPHTLRHKNGRLTDVLLNGSIYKDDRGNALGVVIVARDVTDQKRIASELTEAIVFAEMATSIAEVAQVKAENATRRAEDAVKAKQQFLSNMSHEIRTPMNAIIGFTKVVLKTNLTAKQKEYLTAIKMSGDALIVLINDILDLAKVDAGKMTFEQAPFRMADSISSMLHLFEPKVQEKILHLVKDYDKNIPEVLVGDAVRLHQIILNLVSNAVKFTEKGKITVSVKMVHEEEENVTIGFAVTDTGIGIHDSKLATIFENFQQASSTTSRIFGGTGLGLAIVKQLVEAQGGTVSVQSQVGEGSTFAFTLTYQKTKETTEAEAETFEIDLQIKDIKVLVVEDIALNQLLMKTLLDDFGFERDIAANGEIAIEKLKTKSYDIILMDLQMPVMNGFEATEYIRNTMNSRIPILALTADVTTVDVAKCRAVGMNDYIAKPVDERVLYNKIIGLVKKPMPAKNNKVAESEQSAPVKTRRTDLTYMEHRTKKNPALMMEMIGLYLEQTPTLVASMKRCAEEKDWGLLQATVHKMIPSFSIVGISRDFEDMAKQLQEYVSSVEQEHKIHGLVNELSDVCMQACAELKEELNRIKITN